MHRIIIYLIIFISTATCCKSQQTRINHPEILLLKAGTRWWPIKLTKQWFEDDTIYTIQFRNARSKTFKTSEQGFFKFEFKSFGKALQKALKIDSTFEVKFSEGTLNTVTDNKGKKQFECHFSNAILLAPASDIKKLIAAINES